MTARKAGITLSLEDGRNLADKINPRLIDLTLTEKRESEADEINIRLQNTDGLLAVPEPGVSLDLSMGWESGDDVAIGMVAKGRFTIAEVEQEGPPDTIILKGQSADMTGALRKRRTQSWADTTLGELLDQIAARHGRSAKVESGLAAQSIAVIEQEGKSDLAFIADLGRRYDAIATWKNGQLIFLPIGGAATASGAALASITLRKRDGLRWTFAQASREEYDGAEAQWHDQDAGRRRTVSTGGENKRKLKRVYASEAEAKQAAQAAAQRGARAPFTFTFETAIADPAMQPDMKVALAGWGERIDGIGWLVESINTTFGAGGMMQSIELESV